MENQIPEQEQVNLKDLPVRKTRKRSPGIAHGCQESNLKKYKLNSVLFKLVIEHGNKLTWDEIARKLEDYIFNNYGERKKLYGNNICAAYNKLLKAGKLVDSDLSKKRREIADNWVRSLQALYDQIADFKILLQDAYAKREHVKYANLSKSLNDVIRLLAEINKEINFNQIIREKLIGLINFVIYVTKEYQFETLKGKLNDKEIRDMKLEYIKYLLNKLPEHSSEFMASEPQKERTNRQTTVIAFANPRKKEEDEDTEIDITLEEEPKGEPNA